MDDRDLLLRCMSEGLRNRGFVGRGRNWRLDATEVSWLVAMEKIPRHNRVGLYVGADLADLPTDAPPVRANDCLIVIHPEVPGAIPGLDSDTLWFVLDLAEELTWEERTASLEQCLDAIASFTRSHATVASLRKLYAAGALRGTAMHWTARGLLEETRALPPQHLSATLASRSGTEARD